MVYDFASIDPVRTVRLIHNRLPQMRGVLCGNQGLFEVGVHAGGSERGEMHEVAATYVASTAVRFDCRYSTSNPPRSRRSPRCCADWRPTSDRVFASPPEGSVPRSSRRTMFIWAEGA